MPNKSCRIQVVQIFFNNPNLRVHFPTKRKSKNYFQGVNLLTLQNGNFIPKNKGERSMAIKLDSNQLQPIAVERVPK